MIEIRQTFLAYIHFPPPSLVRDIHQETNGYMFIGHYEAESSVHALHQCLREHQDQYQIHQVGERWITNFSGSEIVESGRDVAILHDCEIITVPIDKALDDPDLHKAYTHSSLLATA